MKLEQAKQIMEEYRLLHYLICKYDENWDGLYNEKIEKVDRKRLERIHTMLLYVLTQTDVDVSKLYPDIIKEGDRHD